LNISSIKDMALSRPAAEVLHTLSPSIQIQGSRLYTARPLPR
jgi:hypothetical protein